MGTKTATKHYKNTFKDRKQRIYATIAIIFGYTVLAFRTDIIGVTLVDMQVYTGSTSAQISLVFVVSSAAGLLGSIVLVPLHNYYNTFLLIAVSSLMYGVIMAACPWSTSLVVYIALNAAGRLPHCIFSAGMFLSFAVVWQDRPASGSILQLAEIFYSGGAALAPLVAIPFLAENPSDMIMNKTTENDSSSNLTGRTLDNYNLLVTPSVAKIYMQQQYNYSTTSGIEYLLNYKNGTDTLGMSTLSANEELHKISHGETRVQYLFLIAGVLFVIITIVNFVLFYTYGNCDPKGVFLDHDKDYDKVNTKEESKKDTKNASKCDCTWQDVYLYSYYVSVSALMVCMNAVNLGYASFLVTFVYYYLKLPKKTGALLNTAYNISGIASCLLHVFLTIYVSTDKLLIMGTIFCLISSLALLFLIHVHWVVIWVCTVLIGMSTFPGLCLMQAWGNRIVGADGKFQSFLFVGRYIGMLVFPAVMGLLFETVGTVAFLYGIAVCAGGLVTSAVSLKLFEMKIKRKSSLEETTVHANHDAELKVTTAEI